MWRRTLQGTKLNGTGLASKLACNKACKIRSCTWQLLMSERIYKVNAVSKLTYISSVCGTDSLWYSNHDRRLLLQKLSDSSSKSLKIKCRLRQVNQIWTLAVLSLGQRRWTCQPSRITSHNLYNRNDSVLSLQAEAVTDNLLHGGTDIFCSASISRCVICQCKVIINRLRTSDESCWKSCNNRIIG